MRASLQSAGIETADAAKAVIRQARRRGLIFIGVVWLSMMLLGLLLPKALPLALGICLFALVWVVSSTLNGQRYIKRYIEEVLQQGSKID
jgi:hypothetical protein